MNVKDINKIIKEIYKKPLLKDSDIDKEGTILKTTDFLKNLPKTEIYSKENLTNLFYNFYKIRTVGDGTCFVHSFLTSVSETYRKIPYADRSDVGKKFRQEYYYDLVNSIDNQYDLP